jgi:transposase
MKGGYIMASITKKNIKGNIYYYVRESKRIDGKPKIVWQKYLGTIENIINAVENKNTPTIPDEVTISRFAAVAAIYDLASRWNMVDIIDRATNKRGQGLSVGNYMLIAAINRCVCPKSKRQIGEWFFDTPLRRWLPVDKKALSSQRFWDNMALLDAATIRQAEKELTKALIRKFNVDTRCLLYDTTNFATFIDTFNESNTVAQRGKSKQGRRDLRIVGLALLVSSDFHIPLFHETYKGNTHDSKEFDSVVDRLVDRYKIFSQSVEDITLVFDKGNNSGGNLGKLASSPYHFVGSLKLTEVEDLLDIPLADYQAVACPRLQGVQALRITREVAGCQRTVLLTYNEELFLTQSQSILREIRKRTCKLKTLAIQLSRWASREVTKGKKPTLTSIQSKIKEIMKGQYMKRLIQTKLTEENDFPVLSYSVDHKAMDQVFNNRLGKTILFTDNHSWSNEEIILAYRGQFKVEKAFETMKDPHFVSWSPVWHWTDHNVRVHAFYCVLALTLVSLLQRELFAHGIDVSIHKAIEELSAICEVALVRHNRGGKQGEPHIVISKMTDKQRQMFETLRLSRYTEAKV